MFVKLAPCIGHAYVLNIKDLEGMYSPTSKALQFAFPQTIKLNCKSKKGKRTGQSLLKLLDTVKNIHCRTFKIVLNFISSLKKNLSASE